MKQLQAISGREALVRAGLVIVGGALLLPLLSFVLTLGGAEASFAAVVPVLLGLFGGPFLFVFWVYSPWLVGRIERKLWNGSLKLDQADMLRRRGLS